MKRLYLIFLCLSAIGVGCKKSTLTVFESSASVYFDFTDSQRDSLLYTFAYDPAKSADTMYLPVRLSGIRTAKARRFILKVDPDSTTAVVAKHYQALNPFYEIPANAGRFDVPIILFNSDTALQRASVRIKFYLEPTDDLGIKLPGLTEGRLVFSSKLERPDWWGMWMGDYYSQTKHQFFIIVTGQTTLTTGTEGGLDAPKNLYFVSLLTSFLNDPFKWIQKHPDLGYQLEKIAADQYYFFNKANPEKKTLYVLDEQAGKYFFIDENGLEIN